MGFDHPQWETYSSSKHDVRHDLKQLGILPKQAAAPTCQDCHLPELTAALGLTLPEEETTE